MIAPKVSSSAEFLENTKQYERYISETIRLHPEFKIFIDSELETNGPNYIVACWILGHVDKMTVQELVTFNIQIMSVKRTNLIQHLTGNTCNQIFLRSLAKLWLNEINSGLLYKLLDCCQNNSKATVLSHSWLILPTLIKALDILPGHLVYDNIVQNISNEMYFSGEAQMALSDKVLNAPEEYQDQISEVFRMANDTIDLEYGLFHLFERRGICIDFPTPPIQGNQWLVPIRSYSELYEEGVNLSHCVKSYAQKIIDNETYFFKWLDIERATIQLSVDVNKHWYIQDIRGYDNEKLSLDHRLQIYEEITRQFEKSNALYTPKTKRINE